MENLNWIRQLAWNFHRKTGMDVDDLIQEGCLTYLENQHKYSPAKGSLTTFIYFNVYTHYLNLLKKELQRATPLTYIDNPEFLKNGNWLRVTTPVPFLERLEDDPYRVALLILRTPNKYLYHKPPHVRKRLYNILKRWGWGEDRIEKAIKKLINELT